MRKFDAVEIWRNIALGCRDVVRNVAAVEIERYAVLIEQICRRSGGGTEGPRHSSRRGSGRTARRDRVGAARRRETTTISGDVDPESKERRRRRMPEGAQDRIQASFGRDDHATTRPVENHPRRTSRAREEGGATAALAIQCLQRGGRIRVRADRLRRRRRRRKAAIVLQTRGRGYLVRLRIKGTKAEHAAAERVQHVIRRF